LSKNNIRICNERTKELFGQLPDDVKLILGDEMNPQVFDDIAAQGGILPQYLSDIEIVTEVAELVRRGHLPLKSHLFPESPPDPNTTEKEPDEDDQVDDEDLDEFLGEEIISQVKDLHERDALSDPTLSLKDVPKLYDRIIRGDAPFSAEIDNAVESLTVPRNLIDMDPANILPAGTRRKTVRFQIPALK
jgi:hypothetical protein